MKKRGIIPKISIVTPSLNQGKYLEQTILSVLSQNYPNLEYVIIDGGSQDESVKIIKKYAKKLKFWESKKDKGQWDAINKGFAKTDGEIMTWLNSDDILMPGSLNLVANIFKQLPKVDWISGIPTTINDEGFIMHVGFKPSYIRKFIRSGLHHGAGLGYIMQEGTFWRRNIWELAGGRVVNADLIIDYKLWKEFAKYTELIPVFTSLAAFRLNPKRKTQNFNNYFKELGIPFPNFFRFIFFPTRLLLHFGLRKMGLTSFIYYNYKKNDWVYNLGLFSLLGKSSKTKVFTNKSHT